MAAAEAPHDRKAPLRHKVCGLCEQPLERARQGYCAAIWLPHEDCFWVPTLRDYAPGTALRISKGEVKPWL